MILDLILSIFGVGYYSGKYAIDKRRDTIATRNREEALRVEEDFIESYTIKHDPYFHYTSDKIRNLSGEFAVAKYDPAFFGKYKKDMEYICGKSVSLDNIHLNYANELAHLVFADKGKLHNKLVEHSLGTCGFRCDSDRVMRMLEVVERRFNLATRLGVEFRTSLLTESQTPPPNRRYHNIFFRIDRSESGTSLKAFAFSRKYAVADEGRFSELVADIKYGMIGQNLLEKYRSDMEYILEKNNFALRDYTDVLTRLIFADRGMLDAKFGSNCCIDVRPYEFECPRWDRLYERIEKRFNFATGENLHLVYRTNLILDKYKCEYYPLPQNASDCYKISGKLTHEQFIKNCDTQPYMRLW